MFLMVNKIHKLLTWLELVWDQTIIYWEGIKSLPDDQNKIWRLRQAWKKVQRTPTCHIWSCLQGPGCPQPLAVAEGWGVKTAQGTHCCPPPRGPLTHPRHCNLPRYHCKVLIVRYKSYIGRYSRSFGNTLECWHKCQWDLATWCGRNASETSGQPTHIWRRYPQRHHRFFYPPKPKTE
jgi:hypothetical protein